MPTSISSNEDLAISWMQGTNIYPNFMNPISRHILFPISRHSISTRPRWTGKFIPESACRASTHAQRYRPRRGGGAWGRHSRLVNIFHWSYVYYKEGLWCQLRCQDFFDFFTHESFHTSFTFFSVSVIFGENYDTLYEPCLLYSSASSSSNSPEEAALTQPGDSSVNCVNQLLPLA
jgi:hypothetical protein